MLTNLGPQTLDTIQRMMGLIDDYDQTRDDLGLFMAAARREGMVDQGSDGNWVLLEGR